MTHFLAFFVGGTTFIAGTACYYYPDWSEGGLAAGVLYTVRGWAWHGLSLLIMAMLDPLTRFRVLLNGSCWCFWHFAVVAAQVGSLGFLYVDVLEFFTFTDDAWLRANIAMSAVGSTW